MQAPLIVTLPHKRYPQAELVSALGTMHELCIPLNVREEEKKTKVDVVGFCVLDYDQEFSFSSLSTVGKM